MIKTTKNSYQTVNVKFDLLNRELIDYVS